MGDDLWQDIVPQTNEGIGIAEELSNINQKGLHQLADFFGMLLQILEVISHIAVVCDNHAATNAPQNGRCLVRAEVQGCLPADMYQNLSQDFIGFFFSARYSK